MHNFKRPLSAASVTELSYTMKSVLVIIGLLVAAAQAAPGERFSDGPTPLNVYMPLREGGPKVQTPKITGGKPATVGQFPHQGALIMDLSTFCGCSLISASWVLTAAHCAFNASSFQVILGRLHWTELGGVSMITSSKIVHHDYDPSTLKNDIALVNLPANVTFTGTIRPVSLPQDNSDDYLNADAIVSGFGTTSPDGGTNTILNFASLKIISNTICKNSYGDIIQDSTICASGAEDVSPCVGDSGGALVINKGITYMQIGILSFWSPEGCTASGYPSGYTRVTFFLDWIYENTGLEISL